jgi:hypothetical protein
MAKTKLSGSPFSTPNIARTRKIKANLRSFRGKVTRKARSPSGSHCGVDLADVVTIDGLDLGEQDAHRGDDASHDQCECNVRVCRLHEIPLRPRLREPVQRFARLTVLVNGKNFGPKMRRARWPNLDHRCIRLQKIS